MNLYFINGKLQIIFQFFFFGYENVRTKISCNIKKSSFSINKLNSYKKKYMYTGVYVNLNKF